MIRWIFLLSIFLINNDLKVLSYNIRYNNPNDGVNHWENRKQTIANFINEENPDFAGLQEVTHSQLDFLLSNFLFQLDGMHQWSVFVLMVYLKKES